MLQNNLPMAEDRLEVRRLAPCEMMPDATGVRMPKPTLFSALPTILRAVGAMVWFMKFLPMSPIVRPIKLPTLPVIMALNSPRVRSISKPLPTVLV